MLLQNARFPQKFRFFFCLKIVLDGLAYIQFIMYQVTFSDQSIAELNKLDKLSQLAIMEAFSSITSAELEGNLPNIGRIHRAGKVYYRLRTGEYRIYFEILPDGHTLHAHYLLHQHTLADFVFRFKLPYREETMFEQEDNFWKYLESLKK